MKYCFFMGIYLCTLMWNAHVLGQSSYIVNLDVTDEPQILTSPGYPMGLQNMYMWKFKSTNHAKIVVLETLDSMFNNDWNCSHGLLRAYDSSFITDVVYHEWCRNRRPMVMSTGRYLTLHLYGMPHIFWGMSSRGFQIRYYQAHPSTPCSHTFTAGSLVKSFISPGYPFGYFNDLSCEYIIQADDATHRILLVFEEFDLEAASACQDDNLTITDLGNGNKQLISVLCGSVAPSYQSATNKLKLKFTTNGNKVNKGFNITYRSIPGSDCTISLTATETASYILSPGYPSSYYSNLECVWTIRSPDPNRTIELITVSSNIEGNFPSCMKDMVQVNDSDATFLGKFCGRETPAYNSTGSNLTVSFSTDGSGVLSGFVVQYRLNQPQASICGGNLTAGKTPQVIVSPNYPVSPLRKTTCIWTIQTEEADAHVFLSLTDMDIEMSETCQFDSVQVFEGTILEGSNRLAQWCGQSSGQFIQSTGQVLTLTYTMDDSNNGRGFSALFYAVKGNVKSACDFNLTAKDTVSRLASPRFPDYYPTNLDCRYLITADDLSGKLIKVEVIYSNLPKTWGSKNCTSDYVKVYDGTTIGNRELKPIDLALSSWCDSDLPTFVSTGPHLLLVFHTEEPPAEKNGFVITYSQGNFEDFIGSTCAGTDVLYATSDPQNLLSPGYPNDYKNNLDCQWTIHTATTGKQIRIVGFARLGDNNAEHDCNDTLEIYEGNVSESTMLMRLCGPKNVRLQSSDDVVIVVFSTAANTTRTGRRFQLQFIETSEPLPCDSLITSSDLTMAYYYESEGYPGGYIPQRNCSWLIHGGEKNREFDFISYGEDGQLWDCTHQHVKIYDGTNESSPMIGQYCGAKALKVISSGDYVFVRHVTGDSPVGKGFRIYRGWSVCPSVTNEVMPGETHYITSLNNPYMYPNNIECSWRLYLRSWNSHMIVLQVLESDIEISTGCHKDNMEVYDGYYRMPSNLLGRWCGRETPTYVALLGEMKLYFRADGSGVGTGFNISYTAVDRPDWPTLPISVEPGETKYITSLKYYNRYPDDLNISWALTVQDSENYTIVVQVLMSDVENSTGCHKDWMEAYDGLDRVSSNLLGRWCGRQTPTYTSTSASMSLYFSTDSRGGGEGFNISYTAISKHTGWTSVITSSASVITYSASQETKVPTGSMTTPSVTSGVIQPGSSRYVGALVTGVISALFLTAIIA